jgi:phosphatidylinositol N-acetylglucosaminyltransferase subunit A
MGGNAIIIGSIMGIKTVLSEHSLFDLGDYGGIHLNKGIQKNKKVLSFENVLLDHIISVSYMSKKNIIYRIDLKESEWEKISVIPNAVDSKKFKPRITKSIFLIFII